MGRVGWPLLRVCACARVTPPPPSRWRSANHRKLLIPKMLLSSEDWRLQCVVDARKAQMRAHSCVAYFTQGRAAAGWRSWRQCARVVRPQTTRGASRRCAQAGTARVQLEVARVERPAGRLMTKLIHDETERVEGPAALLMTKLIHDETGRGEGPAALRPAERPPAHRQLPLPIPLLLPLPLPLRGRRR